MHRRVLLYLAVVLASSLLAVPARSAERPFAIIQDGIESAPSAGNLQTLAATHASQAWLLCAWQIGAIVESDDEICRLTAFLLPTTATARLRRGPVERGILTRDKQTGQLGWMIEHHRYFVEYAQVPPPGQTFGTHLQKPAPLGLPFLVRGKVSDVDLVAIADLVWQRQQRRASKAVTGVSKTKPDGTVEMLMDSESTGQPARPIGYLERKADGSVEISTVPDKSAWQIFRLVRRHGGWVIVEIAEAIA